MEENRMTTHVYLAGKIAPHTVDWRRYIISEDVGMLPRDRTPYSYFPSIEDPVSAWPTRWEPRASTVANDVLITGPFFIEGEGHDGMHNLGGHGVGPYATGGPYAEIPERRAAVIRLCREAIASSDVVFAWLDDLTAYATLYELGVAHALGKVVVVATPQCMCPGSADLDGHLSRCPDAYRSECAEACVPCHAWFALGDAHLWMTSPRIQGWNPATALADTLRRLRM
jgi:hypothetical protein